MKKNNAFFKIFLRYVIKNILILLLPVALALFTYQNSLTLIKKEMDTIMTTQLESSKSHIEEQLRDIRKITTQLTHDYETNYYMNKITALSDPEYYNLNQLSKKINFLVQSNSLLSHCFIYFRNNNIIIFENGISGYDSFYGPLFRQAEVDSVVWKKKILEAPDNTLIGRQQIRWKSVQEINSIVVKKSIGSGQYHRGSVIGIIDTDNLNTFLSNLAREYSGWVRITDSSGQVITSTSPVSLTPGKIPPGTGTIRIEGDSFRYYSITPGLYDWNYTAVVNETVLFKDIHRKRNFVIMLLALVLITGFFLSYYFARTNTKPMARIMNLIFRNEIPAAGINIAGIYELAEKKIIKMAYKNQQMKKKLETAGKTGYPKVLDEEKTGMQDFFYYPLNIEQQFMTAVRTGNPELLASLFASVIKENFRKRRLSSCDVENLYMALRCTILRMKNEFSKLEKFIGDRLGNRVDKKFSIHDIEELHAVLKTMAEHSRRRNKSNIAGIAGQIYDYILMNYSDSELSLSKLAKTFKLSENYISNLYKEQNGECLSLVLQKTRVGKAIVLLKETRDPVNRIAAKTGYQYTSSFRRAFKRLVGASPSDYRKRMIERNI